MGLSTSSAKSVAGACTVVGRGGAFFYCLPDIFFDIPRFLYFDAMNKSADKFASSL